MLGLSWVYDRLNLSSLQRASLATLLSACGSGAAAFLAIRGGDTTVAVLAAIGCGAAALAWVRLRGTSASVKKASTAISAAANGNLRDRVKNIRGRGDIGALLNDINRMLDQVESFGKEVEAVMAAAADKRFYRKVQLKGFRGDFVAYGEAINVTLARMEEIDQRLALFSEDMLKEAVTIAMTVNESNMANAHIVSGIRKARDDSQGMASATDDMVLGMQSINESAKRTAELSDQAQQVTDQGRSVMQSAMQHFAGLGQTVELAAKRAEELSKASEAIGDILASIESIAAQTNLLALNATIEAARAGDAGRGFAVVASEVKSLAGQTAKSTVEIGELVDNLRQEMSGIVDAMRSGTTALAEVRQAMQAMEGRMDGISDLVKETSDNMRDVSSTLARQSTAAREISGGIQNVATRSDSNASAIEKSKGALSQLEGEMNGLLNALASLNIPNKILLVAKADHIAWKKKVTDLVMGLAKLDPDTLASDRTCRLGKWYFGPDAAAFRELPAFKELAVHHRVVHESGVAAARAYNGGDVDKALELLNVLETASTEVIRCLDDLRRDAERETKAAAA
ncbi:MAG: CZB domain-containing protein [Bradyrhizobium sp.]|uniref:methyl-accepting chemotaxis protein n=1 Tax=Bradyrhizobium sp. TaxID=376 RepID=UPI0025C5ADFA|nr:methyl-accepting chemotaxis protein [Bradyrhizobium sp.]MBI5265245.1 CZB domain-containing protein [Bradyrhizobium sp.]